MTRPVHRRALIVVTISLIVSAVIIRHTSAQTTRGAAAETTPVHATLNQIMRGMQFPHANVIFASQADDPATIKPSAMPSAATDPLTSVFGGWEAVENSSLALAESATILLLPGRRCANGVAVPVQSADWIAFVGELRAASMASYEAARSKNQDRMLDISERLAASCASCHQVYRRNSGETGSLTGRCVR